MKLKHSIKHSAKRIWDYLKDYRFSSILLKYFLLLFICLVLPVTVLNSWYGKQQRKRLYEEFVKRNEMSLEQAYSNVYSVILSTKNLAYSLSVNNNVKYLAYRPSVSGDITNNRESVKDMLSVIKNANAYVDSIYIYFYNSGEVVSNLGVSGYEVFQDKEALALFSKDMPARNILLPRIKKNKYPYLLTVLYPVRVGGSGSMGLIAVNLDVEKLGNYIGSGSYRSADAAPKLLIFDESMETLVYSDEYRLLQEPEEIEKLKSFPKNEEILSEVYTLWGGSWAVSGLESREDGLRYLYLSSMQEFEKQNKEADTRIRQVAVLTGMLCLLLAFLLAVWVYRPVKRTLHVLSEVSMLTEWDRKEHVDEIEAIQRSILSAKKENDDLNAQIQERIISLHNAQICALQTQINPHFLFNTLEAIANAAALLMNGDNQITEMIYTLGKLMRISLSNENYLVPLKEELEHVKLYVKLVEFRYHGRVCLHQEIPEELQEERIIKLTLQPLIENAIQHGLAGKRSGGNIWLKGEKKGKDNYIYVVDNGTGVTEEMLEKLREQLKDSAITGSRHIGMRNVDQRLKLVFGEGYGLTVGASKEGGMCVIVRFQTL